MTATNLPPRVSFKFSFVIWTNLHLILVEGTHIIGAEKQPIADVQTCLSTCASSSEDSCLGVDFNFNNNGCYFHTGQTACNSLVGKSNCNHYTGTLCAGGKLSEHGNVKRLSFYCR